VSADLRTILAKVQGDPDGIDAESLTRQELYAALKFYMHRADTLAEFSARLARAVVRAPHHLDHACGQCVPGGDAVIRGFMCTFHFAEGYIAASRCGMDGAQ